MTAKKIGVERLAQVRDVFLFCCYTELSYADVKKLQRHEVAKGVDGELWIVYLPSEKDRHGKPYTAIAGSGRHTRTLHRPSRMREPGPAPAGTDQPEDEQLRERDRRHLRHQQNADLPHCKAYLRHHGYPFQRRSHRERIQDAGAYQHQDHPALCQDTGRQGRPGHGRAPAEIRNIIGLRIYCGHTL